MFGQGLSDWVCNRRDLRVRDCGSWAREDHSHDNYQFGGAGDGRGGEF